MSDLTRRGALRLGGHLLTGAALGALTAAGAWRSLSGGSPTAQADTDTPALLERPLRIGYLPITDASALLAAHELGLLQQVGVPSQRPILFRSWDAMAQALTTDQVDLVHMLMPMALQLRLGRGADVKVLGWGHTNGSTLTVRPDITETAQLAGSTVAIPFWWSVHNILLQQILAAAGLRAVTSGAPSASEGTVALTVMAPADMVPALAAGSIAGFVVADPFSAVAEAQQVGVVHRFLGDVWQRHACCAITATGSFTTAHPQATIAVVTAIAQAQQWLDAHRGEAGPLLTSTGGYLPQPTPAVSKVFQREPGPYQPVLRHPDWHGERLGFELFPSAGYTDRLVSLMRQTAVLGETGFLDGLTGAAAHTALVDDGFARQALARLNLPVPGTRTESLQP